MCEIIRTEAVDIVDISNQSKRFVFISDLHLDRFYQGHSMEELSQLLEKKRKGEASFLEYEEDDTFWQRKDLFIQFVKKNFSGDVLILAGDYYTDFRRTLDFVKRLETEKIESFFVLGNHDFSSNDQTGFDDIISLFVSTTASHEYCKFLMTGKKYYFEDVCIIGDTGWNLTNRIGPESIMHIPKRYFDRESKKWIKFATKVLSQEKKVLIVTHFPQADLSISNDWKYLDWATTKLYLEADHCWKIFGHTHQRKLFQFYNNVCLQQGYKTRGSDSSYQLYNRADFGILEKRVVKDSDNTFELATAFNSLLPFYSSKLIQDEKKESLAVIEITARGFKRTGHADNKRAIAALINDKQAYLDRVKKV